MSVTIRIPPEVHAKLRALATSRRQPIGAVVAAAVDSLDERTFWEGVRADYERLYADPAAAAAYEAEFAELDVTLADGLADDPWTE